MAISKSPTFFILDNGINFQDEDRPEGDAVVIIGTTWYPTYVKVGYCKYNPIPSVLSYQFKLKSSHFPKPNDLYQLELEFFQYLQALGLSGLRVETSPKIAPGWYWGRLGGTEVEYGSLIGNFLISKGHTFDFVHSDVASLPPIRTSAKYSAIMSKLTAEIKLRSKFFPNKKMNPREELYHFIIQSFDKYNIDRFIEKNDGDSIFLTLEQFRETQWQAILELSDEMVTFLLLLKNNMQYLRLMDKDGMNFMPMDGFIFYNDLLVFTNTY